jgi:polysaccharide deacetylase family protein (PEP-CTERM system associated)
VATTPVVNAMTVDVEEHFQVSAFDRAVSRADWPRLESRVSASTDRLLTLFDRRGVRGTFFVLGVVAERFPDLVRRIAARGHEIASHGYGHRLVYEQTRAEFRDDIRRAKGLLEQIVGRLVNGYRAPSYSVTTESLWALDVLIEEGHTYDASIFPIRHDRYGIPDAPRHPFVVTRAAGSLVEAPASTVRIGPLNLPVAGGGYFRILPYAWTRWGLGRVNTHERRPAIFYLHPWELDPHQPRFAAGRLSRFRHYRNLHLTEARLGRLIDDFRFAPLSEVLDRLVIGSEVGDTASNPVKAGAAPTRAWWQPTP